MKRLFNNKGYTLIEIMISMSIFSVVLVMSMGVYLNFIKFHNNIEKNSFANTNIINAINNIKYSIDQTTYLEIVSKKDIIDNKKKNKDFKYIMLDDGNIVSGQLNKDDRSIILKKEEIDSSINLKFKKDTIYPSNLIIELSVLGMNKPLTAYVNIQNMQYNNLQIQGDNNIAIIYKKE